MATSNRPSPEDQFSATKVLTASEQAEILDVFAQYAAGREARPLVAAADGYRWSDVPGALRAAAGPCFVGVASVSTTDETVKAMLVLDDGQEGEAIVTRTPDGVAVRASMGVLGDAEREAKFERLFHRALARMALVRKPQ